MIIDYNPKYDEEVKNLLVELQEYLTDIDREKYNIVGKEYREKYFEETMKIVKEKQGKIMLYKKDDKVIGLIIGIVNNEKEDRYDFSAPKRGRITEFIVSKDYRNKGIGNELLNKMKEYLKGVGCEKILIAVFGYNKSAIEFYNANGFHMRMIDMIED